MNILHAFEQFEALLRDLAPALYKYKEHLKKEGFTDNQAFRMALEMQKSLVANAKNSKG